MAPEVLRIVLQRDSLSSLPSANPAVLPGYARHAIRDRVYPAIIPSAGHSVDGLVGSHSGGYIFTPRSIYIFQVLRDLTPSDVMRLNAFEAPEYELRDVRVDGENTKAYVWRDEYRCVCVRHTVYPPHESSTTGTCWSLSNSGAFRTFVSSTCQRTWTCAHAGLQAWDEHWVPAL